MIRRLDAAIFEAEGSLRAVSIMRAITGAIVVLHLKNFLRDMGRGMYYGDNFYVPYASWYPELPRYPYWIALCLCVAAGVLMMVGRLRRPATIYAAAFVAYNLFLSKTYFHHNRAFLLIMLIGLSLVPATPVRSEGRGKLWPIWWMRFEHALIYFASGFSKLLDPDWFGGTVLHERVLRFEHRIAEHLPASIVDLLTHPTFHYWFAKLTVATELFIALGLWFRRTRLAAIWVALVFHLSIEVTAMVQIFTAISVAAMLLWVTPELRTRAAVVNTAVPRGRRLRWLLRWFDWLARFRVETVDDPSAPALTVDGDASAEARWLVLTRLPALYFFTWPASVVARVLRGLRGDDRNPGR